MKLDVTNRILRDAEYQDALCRLKKLENGRKFCLHDMEHFLSVARICCILCAENGIDADKDIIYSAALLHDIGRIVEYTTGESHHIAGKNISDRILARTGCSDEFRQKVTDIILNHGEYEDDDSSLNRYFFLADKKSRMCFMCEKTAECYWKDDRKNMEIEV